MPKTKGLLVWTDSSILSCDDRLNLVGETERIHDDIRPIAASSQSALVKCEFSGGDLNVGAGGPAVVAKVVVRYVVGVPS